MSSLLEFFTALPGSVLVLIGIVGFVIIFAIFRRLIKFAFTIAALLIVVLVIMRLLDR